MNDNTTETRGTAPHLSRRARALLVGGVVAALVAGATGLGAWARVAASTPSGTGGAQAAEQDAAQGDRLQERLQQIVDSGYPAALATVTAPDGGRVDAVAGTGDRDTGAAPPEDGEVRIASNTKMFVATVVLQLVEEGRVDLDEPIDSYLPGLVAGDGIDGAAISVRQLLQHTSGLPEYADEVAADAFGVQHDYISPRDMLDVALARPAASAPGERWEYSNTNYLVLGLLVERVTHRPLAEQIDERIVRPLELAHAYFPAPGEQDLRGEHPHGYHSADVGELRDISELDPSFAWAAGAMVSTPSELNTFMQALLDGRLLGEAALAELQTTVPAGDELWPEAAYGLGLQRYPLSCGGVAWGHGGDIPGTQTRNAVGPDGTAVTIAVTALPWAIVDQADEERLLDSYRIVVDALDETLCD
ncbi:serine hydrolase domain-containing protein [Microbacterium marinilacus]|uniref:Serine hydrolase domain-containing protein n=1 Tax=Microbacterium marinilacus TaxID=415209 RepID=A0ABP7BK41_9MICO|nr:serine hydrolase domain-containing protein [Microbacterium marinilacus]MBY0689786.1 beta-lactamase family protein [Microbacterium marinilacus]